MSEQIQYTEEELDDMIWWVSGVPCESMDEHERNVFACFVADCLRFKPGTRGRYFYKFFLESDGSKLNGVPFPEETPMERFEEWKHDTGFEKDVLSFFVEIDNAVNRVKDMSDEQIAKVCHKCNTDEFQSVQEHLDSAAIPLRKAYKVGGIKDPRSNRRKQVLFAFFGHTRSL